MVDTKTCIACRTLLPVDEFYMHRLMRDARLNKCKACCKRQEQVRRASKLETIRDYDRNRPNRLERIEAAKKYRNTDVGRAAQRRAQADWVLRNAQKIKAQAAVNNAVRDGWMTKPDHCEGCGEPNEVEGHHDDYNFPLVVRWLCDPCHKKHHKMLRNSTRKIAA